MIPKKARVPLATFPRTARTVFRGEYISLKEARNGFSYNRLGVIVGKKVSSLAVERNRIRRRIFDFFRASTTFFDKKKGIDLLVIVNPSMIEISDKSFRETLKTTWEHYSMRSFIDHS